MSEVTARLKSTKSHRLPYALAAIGLSTLLTGCIGGPSTSDVLTAVGYPDITDVNCVQASGLPGHVCTFNLRGYSQTRRLVKRDDGGWDALYK